MMVPIGRQNPTHPGFVAADQPYSCRACVSWHATQHQFPDLDPENALAWDLYMTFQDQQRIGMDVIGLDVDAIRFAFELYEIPQDERLLLFEKLHLVDRCVQERRAKEREREQQKRDAKGRGLG